MTKPSDEAMVTPDDMKAARAHYPTHRHHAEAFARHRQAAVDAERAEIVAMIAAKFDAPHIIDAGRKIADAIANRSYRGDGTAP